MNTEQFKNALADVLQQNNEQLKTVYQMIDTNSKVAVIEYEETAKEDVQQWAFIMQKQFVNAGLPEIRWVSKAAKGFKDHALT